MWGFVDFEAQQAASDGQREYVAMPGCAVPNVGSAIQSLDPGYSQVDLWRMHVTHLGKPDQ